MFVNLFLRECKQNLKSIIFILIIALTLLFISVQYTPLTNLTKPVEGQEYYGEKTTDNKDIIMKTAISNLITEYMANDYATYPILFYKSVKLNDNKSEKVKNIIEKIIGEEIPETLDFDNSSFIYNGENYFAPSYSRVIEGIDIKVDYEEFESLMTQVDDILGGGTDYTAKGLAECATEPMTYEDAMEEYNDLVYGDKIANGCARLFCDYTGIMLSILPIFIAVYRCLKDKRNKAADTIFAKQVSSSVIILSRYLSIVCMIIVVVMFAAIQPTLQCVYLGNSLGVPVDVLAFFRLIILWLLPIVLFVTALGFVVTELIGGVAAIFVQVAIFFISNFCNRSLVGNAGMNLIPRFNTIGNREIFIEEFNYFLINRSVYTLIAIAFVVITIFIYDAKRKGKINANGKISKLNESKSEN